MSDPVLLSSSPKQPPTHWKQTVILLPEEAIEETEVGFPIAIHLKMNRSTESSRRYNLELEILDAEKEEHSMPCDCILTKCILTKSHLMAMDSGAMKDESGLKIANGNEKIDD